MSGIRTMASNMTRIAVDIIIVMLTFLPCCTSQFGPKYPLTGAWFKDRFSLSEWNKTLSQFSQQYGDTVMLRAPTIVTFDPEYLEFQPDFRWCSNCAKDARTELDQLGVKPVAFGMYTYEENYDETTIMACPQYDKKIVSSRIYYRLVLPLDSNKLRTPCDLKGSEVLVLFTSFAGVDPHELLLQTAQRYNISVFFGLPAMPEILDIMYKGTPNIELTRRIIEDHAKRFSNSSKSTKNLYDVVKGYYSGFDFQLSEILDKIDLFDAYFGNLSIITGQKRKKLVVSPYVQLNKLVNPNVVPLEIQIAGFEKLARVVDVVAVRDGRGMGRGGYYWSTQNNTVIADVDKDLDKILRYQHSGLKANFTFSDVFIASVHQAFDLLSQSRDSLAKSGTDVELWLNIDAFHYLRDDPCLPVDKAGSGQDQMVNRVTKLDIDWALTAAGPTVSKVTSFAWDPSFTCATEQHPASLTSQIRREYGRPIIAKCFFHSSFNRSVVIIGYNLLGDITQGYTVEWEGVDNKRHTCDDVHGYYFEADWGNEHGKVGSLIYTQFYDCYDVIQLRDHGYVRVSAGGGYKACMFEYDFRTEEATNATETYMTYIGKRGDKIATRSP